MQSSVIPTFPAILQGLGLGSTLFECLRSKLRARRRQERRVQMIWVIRRSASVRVERAAMILERLRASMEVGRRQVLQNLTFPRAVDPR